MAFSVFQKRKLLPYFSVCLIFCAAPAVAQDEQTSLCAAAKELLSQGETSGAVNEELAVYRDILASAECASGAGEQGTRPGPQPAPERTPVTLGPFTEAECKAADQALAKTDGRDRRAGAIMESQDCSRFRKARAFDVTDDMARMMRLLEAEGIDFNSRLVDRIEECEVQADQEVASSSAERMATNDRQQLVDTCSANAQMVLYSEGILELNAARVQKGKADKAAFDAEVARAKKEHESAVAASEAAHRAAMAKWRREVQLCEGGQLQYCAN